MLKGRTPILVATVLSVAAGLLAWRQLKMWKTEVTRGWQLEDVIVANADLQPGNTLSAETYRVDKMPRKFVYGSILVPSDLEVALGRRVVVPVKRGEPLHWYQLQGIRALQRFSKSISKQGRAVTIDVSERSSVGQWIQPNDQVDVLGTFRDPSSNEMVAVTLLQGVIVLATGQVSASSQPTQREARFSTVTLFAMPEEAEVLVLAQQLGSLHLTLRNPEDESSWVDERTRTTIQTLLTGEWLKKYREKRRQIIRIIRGVQPTRNKR